MARQLHKVMSELYDAVEGFVQRAFDASNERTAALEKRVEGISAGPRGEKGQNGANGKDGLDGKDGLNGKDGAPGTNGLDGSPGINGKDGAPGTNGKDGLDGKDGLNGKDGAPGTNGKDGLDGKDGINGKDGAPGTNGKDGLDGKDGLNGKDGAPGTNGKDGAPGTNGKDGLDGSPGINGKDGTSIGLQDVMPLVEAAFSKWALEVERRAMDLFQRTAEAMPIPKDGFSVDDLSVQHDGDGNVTFHFHRGDLNKKFTIRLPRFKDCGVYRDGGAYLQGDGVSYGGSLWLAQRDAPEGVPDSGNGHWRLAVKRGRDGKDAQSQKQERKETIKLR
jgi:integrin beta 3